MRDVHCVCRTLCGQWSNAKERWINEHINGTMGCEEAMAEQAALIKEGQKDRKVWICERASPLLFVVYPTGWSTPQSVLVCCVSLHFACFSRVRPVCLCFAALRCQTATL